MNKFLFLLFTSTITLFNTNNDPKPKKVYSIVRAIYPIEYYHQQYLLWEKELMKNNKNPDAWVNYYTAARMANMLTPGTDEDSYDQKEIVTKAKKAIPDTYEYYHIFSWDSGYTEISSQHALKAYQLDPNRPEVLSHLSTYFELERDHERKKEVCQTWYNSGETPIGLLHWNYNVLASLENNALLLTQGDNDTYPIWLLQMVKNIRPDVTAVNLSILSGIPEYRNQIFKEKGIPPLDKTYDDFSNPNDLTDTLTKHLIKYSKQPIYMGIAINKWIRDNYSNQLFMVGLAFKYSEQSFDNIAVLKDNYENKFLTESLRVDLSQTSTASVVNQMNLNYFPALLNLYKEYKKDNSMKKASDLKQLMLQIARKNNREEKIKAIIDKY